ncbi:hypothetical protein [Aeromicrobium sp. Leaf350]|uniref:hypothetical protein n=1 Tax=Aeromicrobium sp. Leaf350 TaxID=2876565 RepID=UPI001E289FDE|nr:hypothetical protein [Aeromicrobium sp. Leaf350]
MTLTHEPDASVADWFVDAEAPAEVLALQGPPGYEAYATIHFDGASDAADESGYRSDPALVALVTGLCAHHTATPEDVFFALWDGWGEIDGGDARLLGVDVRHRVLPRIYRDHRGPASPPAFGPSVVDAPRADLGGIRSYLLFRGPLSQVGEWGARPLAPGWPRALPQASLTWPRDRAWFIASDVDPAWFTVAGSRELVTMLLGRTDLVASVGRHGSPKEV